MNKEKLKSAIPLFYKLYQSNDLFRSLVVKIFNKNEFTSVDTQNKFSGKIFCIGANKTGTTSVEQVLKSLGYKMGEQSRAEMLADECFERKFDRLIRFCALYDAFQDIPFSKEDYYKELDKAFPDSKFILTIRDSGEQWFSSLCRFHTKIYSSGDHLPTEQDLKNSSYGYKGMAYDNYVRYFRYPEIPLYDKARYIELYEKRNQEIIDYFQGKPDKLLVINVKDDHALQNLGDFLNVRIPQGKKFPHENKT